MEISLSISARTHRKDDMVIGGILFIGVILWSVGIGILMGLAIGAWT